jgi:hypothetical protein
MKISNWSPAASFGRPRRRNRRRQPRCVGERPFGRGATQQPGFLAGRPITSPTKKRIQQEEGKNMPESTSSPPSQSPRKKGKPKQVKSENESNDLV